jgi:hypothetical protein
MASLEKSRNSLRTGGRRRASFRASLGPESGHADLLTSSTNHKYSTARSGLEFCSESAFQNQGAPGSKRTGEPSYGVISNAEPKVELLSPEVVP